MGMIVKLKDIVAVILKPRGKGVFLKTITRNGKILDVGCGNNSPRYTKQKRPDVYYVGLDIGEYNQSYGYENYADQLIITTPDNFHSEIEKFTNEFDAVISAHNLEHCNDPNKVLLAMIKSLKKNGKIYLAFPSEKSKYFPKRKGTLNYYDDPTHRDIINYNNTIAVLTENDIIIDFAARQYKPFILAFIGFLFEPVSRLRNKILPHGATWAYYGFETVIIGHKK
jgi:SAM-dependent methyltransferase